MSWLKLVVPLPYEPILKGSRSLSNPVSETTTGCRGSVISMMSMSENPCSSSSEATTKARPPCCQANTLWYCTTGRGFPAVSVASPKFSASAVGCSGSVMFHSDTPPSPPSPQISLFSASMSPVKYGVSMWMACTPSLTYEPACAGMKPTSVGCAGSLMSTT
jgi:hypothetical protein